MLFYQLIRTKRAPWIALAVMLFAAFLSGILCHLHEKRLQQVDDYARVEMETPVYLIVTDLTGIKK